MSQLATTPTPDANSWGQSVLGFLRNKGIPTTMRVTASPPKIESEVNPDPVMFKRRVRSNISTVDWDELFHAIQVRLENCVNDALDKAPELPVHQSRAVTKIAVLECVEAMRQLHASLALERENHQKS